MRANFDQIKGILSLRVDFTLAEIFRSNMLSFRKNRSVKEEDPEIWFLTLARSSSINRAPREHIISLHPALQLCRVKLS